MTEAKTSENAQTEILTIRVTPRTNSNCDAECTVDGDTFRLDHPTGDAEMEIARKLVAAGLADQPWRTLLNGRPSLNGQSLHRLAMLSTSSSGAGFTPWRSVQYEGAVASSHTCLGCFETGYLFRGCCMVCATLAAHGGLTPSARAALKKAKREAAAAEKLREAEAERPSTDECKRARSAVRQIMSADKHTIRSISDLIGIPRSSFSAWLNNTHTGDIEVVTRKVVAWLINRHKERRDGGGLAAE